MAETIVGIAAAVPRDLSPWGMFLAADLVVQVVIVGLLCAALLSWIVWLVKVLELRAARREAALALSLLRGGESLAALSARSDVAGVLTGVAVLEERTSAGLSATGIRERVAADLGRIEAALARRINRGTGLLATIGSTAPFVGLFGTVWGIMNSFIGISRAQTTNLAVVAPGIAEALLATALGLFAAIPAVVIYNALGRSIAAYRAQLADATTAVLNRLGRELERRA